MYDSAETYSSNNSVPVEMAASPIPDGQAVCIVSFSYSLLGNRGDVDSNRVDADTDKSRLRIGKELLKSPELAAVRKHCAAWRNWLKRRCLPTTVGRNAYLLSLRLVPEVAESSKAAEAEFSTLVDAFIAAYPDRVEEARLALRELFRQEEYPDVYSLRSEFQWKVRYMAFGSPSGLREISRETWEAEQAETRKFWEEARQALRESFLGLIQHATAKLSYGDNGKPAIFRDSMVSNMQEFLRLFADLNQTNDAELTALVERTRAIMAGVDPDSLRNNLLVRDRVRDSFEQVKTVLTDSLIGKSSRSISFSDD